jgi:endoglucanase
MGATDKKDALKRVAIGDSMTFSDSFEMMTDHMAIARGMDNRSGSWVTAEALRLAKEENPSCAIYACSSVQEEVGLMGARMQVANIKPDAALVVDVTFATDTPGIDMKQHGEIKLGDGPVVHVGRENHPAIVDRIRNVARRKKIPVQADTFGVRGGTDAMAIFHHNGGIPSALVSIPNRYMHSTIETIDLRDLEKTARLLAAVAASVKKKDRFMVQV